MVSLRSHFAVIAVVLVLASAAGDAQATIVTATRDTYISSAAPSTNFGPSETLQVSASSTALVWFDVEQVLPTGTTPQQVVKATLQLWVSRDSPHPAGSMRVVAVQTSWQGAIVVYATRPTYPLTSPVTTTLASGLGYYVLVDVTDIVRGWVTSPATNNGLALLAADNSISVRFDSKENSATSHPALLDITLLNPSTVVAGKSFPVCTQTTRASYFDPYETCSCGGKTLAKYWTSKASGSCYVQSEIGVCSEYISKDAREDSFVISCCVCSP
jgi:hypothetical protein